MGFLSFIETLNATFWSNVTDLITLIFVIIYVVAFFVVQYYLIKLYAFIIKFAYNLPIINDLLKKLQNNISSKFGVQENKSIVEEK